MPARMTVSPSLAVWLTRRCALYWLASHRQRRLIHGVFGGGVYLLDLVGGRLHGVMHVWSMRLDGVG